MTGRCAIVVVMTCVLTACSGGSSAGLAQAPAAVRAAPAASLLQQMRAAGRIGVELDVQPLRDPQVQDLRTAATDAEGRGDFDAARVSIDKALLLAPADPDLLQWRAELSLVHRDFPEAERLAQRSFDIGPKSGGLCRRNWTTIQLAAESRGDQPRAGRAREQAASCRIAPPVRM